ncbi:excisionase [Pantoea ananatis]|uniref:excisionase n=1 Tax=Pantoea ananas TaxID=553 RepID=UPI001EE5612D|nr:excisionase [Pantoea ananatis]
MYIQCVPLSAYCQMTGETPEAINNNFQCGIWGERIQVLKVDGVRERWIDLAEVDIWARSNKDRCRSEK